MLMEYGATGEPITELETSEFLATEYERVAEVKVGDKFFKRATLTLKLHEVSLFDDLWLPALQEPESILFLVTERI